MKRPLIAGLSVLLLSAVTATAAHAETRIEQEVSMIRSMPSQVLSNTLTPSDLASLAYRGYFHAQGISSYNQLIYEYKAGRVQAKDLVQAAINLNQLPARVCFKTQ